jgi:hypothetical protein
VTRSRDTADTQDNLGGAVPPFVAGKNVVINGGMDIWQRGTSVATTAGGTNYTADRWAAWSQGPVMTTSRQATSDTTNLPFIQYCARVQRNSGQTSVGAVVFETMIETINTIPLVGKVVTVSFYARAGANFSASSSILNWGFVTGTGTDQNQITGYTGQAVPISAAPSLTTTWQRFTGTGTIATDVNEATVQFYYIPTGTASTNDYVEITGVQVELGNVATPFARAGGSIGGELALCQRYYWKPTGYQIFGTAQTNTIVDSIVPLPSMRGGATALDVSSFILYYTNNGGATSYSGGTLAVVAGTDNYATVRYTHGSAVFTAGQTWQVAATIGIGVEL